MAKAYIFDTVIGTGTREDKFRPAVSAIIGLGWTAVQSPGLGFCFVRISYSNLLEIFARPGVDRLPDFPLDAKIQAMHGPTRNQMRSMLQARGFDSALIDNADGFRDLVRGIGRRFDVGFNEDNFDVAG